MVRIKFYNAFVLDALVDSKLLLVLLSGFALKLGVDLATHGVLYMEIRYSVRGRMSSK